MEKESKRNWGYFGFEDLRVYQKALDLAAWLRTEIPVHSLSDDSEANKLVNAATQIAISIAEGSSRDRLQFVYFLKVAKSYLRETSVRTSLCLRIGIVTEPQAAYVRERLLELMKMIGSLSASIKRLEETEPAGGEEEELSGNTDSRYIDSYTD